MMLESLFGKMSPALAITVKIALIVLLTILALLIVRIVINRFIARSSVYLKIDRTRYNFFRNSLTAIIYIFAIIAIIHTIPSLRSISVTLLAGAGIFAAILGFASQQAFSNVICGVFVVISRPFRVGDIIKVGRDLDSVTELIGTVEDITLRHTVIRDFSNRRILIPNSVINMEVITNNNIVDARVRRILNISVAYESDVYRAMDIIREEASAHPFLIDGRTPEEIRAGEPVVMIRVVELGEYFVKIRAYLWAKNFDDAFNMHCELNLKLLHRFRKENIEIPYPHRTIVQKEERIADKL